MQDARATGTRARCQGIITAELLVFPPKTCIFAVLRADGVAD